jgi:hypothetical protein
MNLGTITGLTAAKYRFQLQLQKVKQNGLRARYIQKRIEELDWHINNLAQEESNERARTG